MQTDTDRREQRGSERHDLWKLTRGGPPRGESWQVKSSQVKSSQVWPYFVYNIKGLWL